MQVVQHDLTFLDPKAPERWQGLALEAMSDQGERLGTVAAKVDGPVAVIFERWVTGELDLLATLISDLITRLQSQFRIRELRAGASDDSLYTCYVERFGMKLWCDLVRYERSLTNHTFERRSSAVIRPFRHADELPVNGLLRSPDGATDVVGLSQQHPSRFVVAEIEQQIIGYALSCVDGSWCLLKSMVVDPRFRNRGIGWDLVCDAIEWAGTRRLPSCLNTQADNVAARKLYESLGYQAVGQVRLVHQALE